MIRQAPTLYLVSVAVPLAVLGFLIYIFIGHEFENRISDFNAAKERLDATIRSMQAALDLDEKRISTLSAQPGALSALGSNQKSKMSVGNFVRVAPDLPVKINVYFKNSGPIAAMGPITLGEIKASSKEFGDTELDNEFKSLYDKAKDAKNRKISFQIEPNEGMFVTITSPTINAEQDISIKEGKGALYTFVLILYKDENTPDGKWRATEGCHYGIANSADHFCLQHNGTILVD